MRWTRKSIIAEINRLHDAGEQLNYSAAEGNHLNLVRAAAWHYGTWRHAVESAGVNYESLSRYQRWNKARIVERITELHKQKQDLSWRAVSTEVDPPLAAAALRVNGFKSWREALAAAGIDVEKTARYQYWDEAKVIKAIRARKRAGEPMSSKSLQKSDQCLFCAARRRFGSWDAALTAAGLNVDKIRLRRHNSSLNAPRARKESAVVAPAAQNGKAAPKAAKAPVAKQAVAQAAGKATTARAAKAATLQLSLDLPATKAAAKAKAATTPAKKAAPAPNGKATAPVKIAAKATPAKATAKTVASKAAPAKKAEMKATSPKTAVTGKTTARKAPAAETAAKQAPVIKPTVAKPAVAKAAVKKAAAKKAPVVGKPTAAKTAAAKTAAKKSPAKSPTAKRAAR